MKNYTLKKEHPTHFELHDADDGKTFSVAKAGLSKDMLSKIKAFAKVQGFPDGGVVEDPALSQDVLRGTEQAPLEQPVPEPGMTSVAPPAGPTNIDEAKVQELPAKIEDMTKPAQSSPASRVFGPGPVKEEVKAPNLLGDYDKNIKQEIGGIQGAAKAQAAGAQQQADIYSQQQEQLKQLMDQQRAQTALINAENAKLTQEVANAKIDPNRYWNSKTTGQKIQSRIALALSGFGSGLTGGPNVVAQLIQKEMDNDIESQKAELGKKENLLSANYKKYGNLQAATQATMLQQNAIAQGQIAAAAAKTNSQVVQQNAQAAIAQLKNQAIPMQKELATWQSLQGAGAQSAGPQQDAMKVRLMVPEKQQAEAFKQLEEAQKMIKAQASLNDAFDKAHALDQSIDKFTSPVQTHKQTEALIEPIVLALAKDTTGKPNEMVVEKLKNLFPKNFDSKKTIELKKKKLNEFIGEKMNFPVLDAYGIKPTNNYGQSGQTVIQEAPAKGK